MVPGKRRPAADLRGSVSNRIMRPLRSNPEGALQTVKKASQNFSRKRKTKSKSFCAGACTWHKILYRLQVWNLFATAGDPIKRERALWGEEMPRHRWNFPRSGKWNVVTGAATICAQQTANIWRKSPKGFFAKLKDPPYATEGPVFIPAAVQAACHR